MYNDSSQAPSEFYNRLHQERQNAFFTRKLSGRPHSRFILLLGFIIIFILACAGGVISLFMYIGFQNQQSQIEQLVQSYYSTLKNKNYTKAISYFDPKGTIVVNHVPQKVSPSQLHELDTSAGQIQKYQVNDPTPVPNRANEVEIAITVMRRGNLRVQQYTVSLILKQEKEGWKIISADRI
jgi:type II secretory pathway pseudopilin PulG